MIEIASKCVMSNGRHGLVRNVANSARHSSYLVIHLPLNKLLPDPGPPNCGDFEDGKCLPREVGRMSDIFNLQWYVQENFPFLQRINVPFHSFHAHFKRHGFVSIFDKKNTTCVQINLITYINISFRI